MKILVVVLSLTSVFGRPDVSHLPSGSYLPGTGGTGAGYSGGSGGFMGGSNFGGSFGGSSFGAGGHGSGINSGFGSFGGGHGGFGDGHGGATDQKNIYFFAAPDEGEQSRLRIFVAPSGARNTKIIFVKAPSYGAVKPEIIAPPSQTEDKTLVYVLVKKPESGGSITIPSTLTSKPTKPEVYFIKYNNQQEAEQAVSGGIQEQSVGSNIKDLGNEQSFIRTLKDESAGIGISGGIGGSFGAGEISGGGISGIIGNGIGGGAGGSLGSTGGGSIGSIVGGGKYGPPGASGPYRR